MNVKDVMLSTDKFPVVSENLFFKEALDVMNEKKLGITCIVNQEYQLKGILTDGDIRRKLLKIQKPLSALFVDDCIEHAILSPVVTTPNTTLKSAVDIMEQKQIWDLPVVDETGKLVGLLHLHPVVQALLNETR
jgi:DeoR family transcriptional regulator, catabolite repression regulator